MSELTPADIFCHSNYKLQVRDVFAMYNHEWDVIGELIQNAVDSVTKRREVSQGDNYQPEITINYDLQNRSIEVHDNGIGISEGDILKVVAPHYSGKEPSGANRGEFGVGLAFVVFSSQKFRIISCYDKRESTLEVSNAYDWSMNVDTDIELEITRSVQPRNTENFTKIWVNPVRFPAFTVKKLEFVLQRFTAIGDFWAAYYDKDGDIKVTLEFIDEQGKQTTTKVKNRLWHPADYLSSLLDYEIVDYVTLKSIEEGPRSAALPNYVGSGMVYKDKMVRQGQEFTFYALMCYSRYYKELAMAAGVTSEEDDVEDLDYAEEEDGDSLIMMPEIDLYPGIFVCKKGMPMGADVPRPPRSGTSNWAAFYIAIHSDGLRTEPGRKKLNIEDERVVQSIARSVLNKMDKFSAYVISRVNPDTHQEAILRALDNNRETMSNWKLEHPIHNSLLNIKTSVEPPNEQTLIALFHELIGSELLKGYKVVKLSATDTYDGLYDYVISAAEISQRAFEEWLKTIPTARERRAHQNSRELSENLIVVEFKLNLETIIGDFLHKNKYHTSIKLLVAWDADEDVIKRRGWFLQKQPSSDVRYFGANYILRPSSEGVSKGILSTHVLLVKRFLERKLIPNNLEESNV
jgi:hypothetical protein